MGETALHLPRQLGVRDRLDLAAAIRADGPEKIVEELWRIAKTSKNDAARVAALSLLASHGWGRPKVDIKIAHTSDDREQRRVYELLADRAPQLLEEIAGWKVVDGELVRPEQRALSAGDERPEPHVRGIP
jgi:hypothetical protein